MKPELIYLFAITTTISAFGFMVVAIVWVRKMRESMANALAEAATQQIRTTQRLNEALARVQKQQDGYNHQIHILAQAGMRLQQELSNMTSRLDNNQAEIARGGQTLH